MHYAPWIEDNNRKYYYSLDLSKFNFWIEYLQTSSAPVDKAFPGQSKQMDFFPSITGVKAQVSSAEYCKNGIAEKWLSPSVSYHVACMF